MNAAHLKDDAARLAALAEHLLPAESVLIVTHDFPDPDCLGAALGLTRLLTAHLSVKKVSTAYGGFVGRAENRAMVRLLDINPNPLCFCDVSLFDRVIVVDALPGGANLSLPPETRIAAVFDHHLGRPDESAPYFFDVRADAGAVSTIITRYLLASGGEIPPDVAAGLFYGIKTDTAGLSRDSFPDDEECYKLLFEKADHGILTRIEHPERGAEFFRMLHRAAESLLVSDGAGFLSLGEVGTPDYVGEMADFFLSLKTIEWMVSSGVFGDKLFYSIRAKTSEEAGAAAEALGRALHGSGGGHGRIGAGRAALSALPAGDPALAVRDEIRRILGLSGEKETSLLNLERICGGGRENLL